MRLNPRPVVSWSLAVLPVKNTVLLPYMFLPLTAGRAQSAAAIEAALTHEEKALIIVAQKNAAQDQPAPADLYRIATARSSRRWPAPSRPSKSWCKGWNASRS